MNINFTIKELADYIENKWNEYGVTTDFNVDEFNISIFDGVLDDMYFLGTVNKNFDIELYDGSYIPFNNGHGWFENWKDESSPTVEEVAITIIGNIKNCMVLVCGAELEQIIELNRIMKTVNPNTDLETDLHGRNWTIEENKVIVEG